MAGGYRTELYKQLTNSGASFAFLGSQTDNPSSTLTAAAQIHHEGHSGYRTDQIYNNLKGNDGTAGNNGGHWLDGGNGTGRSAISPAIVLLHIGTNDRTQGENVPTMYNKLVTLLNDLKLDLPNATIFVASLIPRTDNATDEADQETYSSMIPGLVASMGTHFHFVDMHSAVTPAEVAAGNSGLHPDQAGYDAMGNTWFNAMQSQQGQIAETDQSNIGDNNPGNPNNSTFHFTSGETITPNAALLTNLLTGSTAIGNATDEGTLAGLTDLNVAGQGLNGDSLNAMAYYGNGTSGSSLASGATVTNTIALGGTSRAPGGYTLADISVFSGWTDHASFNDQHYSISVSRDGTNFARLYAVAYLPFAVTNDLVYAGDQDASTLVTLTNLNANGLTAGIKSIRFVFSAGLDTNGTAQAGQLIQEIEVFGTPSVTNVVLPGQIDELDQSNIGDNNSDAANSQFYFTSGQSLNTSAALQTNLLTGSTVTSSTGGADVGSVSAVNDVNAQTGSGAIAYYGNTLYGSSLTNGGKVMLTIPLGGATPGSNGYTLSSLSVYDGWTDHASFNDQNYSVTVSRDGTNYIFLDAVSYMPFSAAGDLSNNQSSSTLVTLTNLNASGLATGIKYIRFTLTAGTDANSQLQEGQLIQEIEVFGATSPAPGAITETDQSNIGDNNNDAGNSVFYFTSGRSLNASAALKSNLLTGSTGTCSTGGADVGSVAAVNDLAASTSTGDIDYYGNTVFGSSLNPATASTHGVVTLTFPLGGGRPSAYGYTLTNISVFDGWTDYASFVDQHYTISTSTDGTNYSYLYAVNYMPFLAAKDIAPAGDQDASTLVTLSNMTASSVKFIRFTLSAGTDRSGALQAGQLIQEIEVFGISTTPAIPQITAATATNGNLVFSGSNGVSNGSYHLLTSTNAATPLANWTVLSTNSFDANGNFSVTNPVSTTVPQQFYLLRLP